MQANTTGLLLIQRLDPIYADFTITERDLPNVQKEMTRGTLKTLVRLPSDPEEHVRGGKLTFLDNTVQNGTGTVFLRATISNPDHHFWPGQFLNVRLVLATQKGAVLIPNQATQISQKGPFVYVVKPDNTVAMQPLTTMAGGDACRLEESLSPQGWCDISAAKLPRRDCREAGIAAVHG